MNAGTLDQLDLHDEGDTQADPPALGRLIVGVRDIIEAARTQSLSLQSTIEQASALDGDIAAASRQLHERLSLSARMLKAFQSQIERIERSLEGARADEARAETLNQRMRTRIDEFETRLERYLERFDARLEEMTSRASKRFKADVAEQEAALKAAAEALPAVDARISRINEELDHVEATWASAHGSLREAVDDAREAQCDLKNDAERLIEVTSGLGAHSRDHVVELEAHICAACDAGRDLEARSARAYTLLPSIDNLERVRARVSELLTRLEPALPILRNEEEYAVAQVERAADLLRAGMERELREIAGAFERRAEATVLRPTMDPPHQHAPMPVVEVFLPEPAGAD